MTTERPDAAAPADRPATGVVRPLRRRANGKVIGGVAGGLGDYLNLDPLLLRIGFVALMVFGGAGLVLYVLTWILLPAEGDDQSIVERLLERAGLTPRRIGIVALVIGGAVFINALLGPGINMTAVWAAGVIVIGILLLRRDEPRQRSVEAVAAAPAPEAVAAVQAPPVAVERPPRPRSPLGWYVIAAALCTVGLLAIVDHTANVEVELGQFFGAALAVLGIGLVIGAWWGRARLLILLGLLVLPLAVVGSFVTAPLEGGIGDQRFAPVNAAELRDEYRLLGGRIILDLTGLAESSEPLTIDASVAVGQLVVILPVDASIRMDTRVGAGDAIVFSAHQVGTSLADRYVRDDAAGPTFVLDLEAGIGEVLVDGGPLSGEH